MRRERSVVYPELLQRNIDQLPSLNVLFRGGQDMISFFTSCCFLLIAKTPPEKKINSFAGFRTKASMKNQEKWAYAQKEMIKYSEKRVFSTFLIGCLFFLAEVYVVLNNHSGNFFAVLLIVETILFLWLLVRMYRRINQSLK
jgi:uncharacterized membrane protein